MKFNSIWLVEVSLPLVLYNILRKKKLVFTVPVSFGREGVKKVESKLLTLYSDIQSKPVQWLWRPYIPVGKVTLLQGDPNDGKSTMMMNIVPGVYCVPVPSAAVFHESKTYSS